MQILEMTSSYWWWGSSDKFSGAFDHLQDIPKKHVKFENNQSSNFRDYMSSKNWHRRQTWNVRKHESIQFKEAKAGYILVLYQIATNSLFEIIYRVYQFQFLMKISPKIYLLIFINLFRKFGVLFQTVSSVSAEIN